MGLVNKLKNILFEEEEVEIPVIEKKEKVVEQPISRELPKKEEIQYNANYNSFYNEEVPMKPLPQKEVIQPVEPTRELHTDVEQVSEREIFKSEKAFNFPAFDEEEFESSLPKRSTNVMEHERRKAKEKIRKNPEVKKEEPNVKTKFRPSPIISPVYGILDKNYTPEDITTRDTTPKVLDVDSVRKKAFGTLEEEIMDVSLPDDNKEDKILEEKLEKARTIDELLKDSSDEIIDVPNSISENIYDAKEYLDTDLEDTITDLRKEFAKNDDFQEQDLDATIDSLEDQFEEPETSIKEEASNEDSLESDLFDLIDSMYENREDGE